MAGNKYLKKRARKRGPKRLQTVKFRRLAKRLARRRAALIRRRNAARVQNVALRGLNRSIARGTLNRRPFSTREGYLDEFSRILKQMYRKLDEPILDKNVIEGIRQDNLPDVELYNQLWEWVIDDLVAIFAELEGVEESTVSNFNFATTEGNRLTARLKAVDSKLGDYILYSLSPSKDLFFYKDSFNDLSKVSVDSPLLNETQCDVNQAEGIVTLPGSFNEDSLVSIKQLPVINPNSNGVPGNNQQIGSNFNGNLAVLLDNNPDTWFEYERVILKTDEEQDPLVLDITMNLGEEQIINYIRVNPNNFGTKTIILIDEIETSIDGRVYTSIKDEIPVAGFTSQDEENIFSLAPSTSKFAGQGLYSFTPRKVKYIRFVFQQTEPYVIQTGSGERLRYAIGLRDIDIRGIVYENAGELISEPFTSNKEISKVSLETNQNPVSVSELVRIQYYISPNDGGTWYELQPKQFNGPIGLEAAPEIINFNTGDENSVDTPVPVNNIRMKIRMTRDDEAFTEGTSSLNKTITNTSELHPVPQGSPFWLNLENPPVDGTVLVVDPLFGSRGIAESQYIVGHASERLDFKRYRLPFKNFPRPMKKVYSGGAWQLEPVPASEYIHVEVGGIEWDHADQPLEDYTIDFNNLSDYRKYVFHPHEGVLEFGDGVSNTMAPTNDQPVTVYFEPERLYPGPDDGDHTAQLEFVTSNNKDDFTIKRYGEIQYFTETVPRRATIIRLTKDNVIDETGIGTGLNEDGFNTTPETFVNGREELQADTNSWSVDKDTGTVYTARPTSGSVDVSVSYSYQPITTLSTDDWDWATTALLRDSVQIKDEAWETEEVLGEDLPITQNLKVVDLSKLGVIEGTLQLTVTVSGQDLDISDTAHPFVKEVAYINGVAEFGGEFTRVEESVPQTVTTDAGNRVYFDLSESISTRTAEHNVVFSNTTLFATKVAAKSNVTSSGEYYVERSSIASDYSRVYFYSTKTTFQKKEQGTVTYYHAKMNQVNAGQFSVDYRNGRIFTRRPINEGNISATYYQIQADFQYADYRAEYKIARLLDLNSYNVDVTNQRVVIKDSEILKHMQTPHSSLDGRTPLYLVNYDYVVETKEDVGSLAPKFSPVLKDYALRVLTKGSIT